MTPSDYQPRIVVSFWAALTLTLCAAVVVVVGLFHVSETAFDTRICRPDRTTGRCTQSPD